MLNSVGLSAGYAEANKVNFCVRMCGTKKNNKNCGKTHLKFANGIVCVRLPKLKMNFMYGRMVNDDRVENFLI